MVEVGVCDGRFTLTGGSAGRALAPGSFVAGVGSKMSVQPSPASQTSGQAWASKLVTWYTSPRFIPGVKPTARRAGMPSERAMTAYVAANWTQNPLRRLRKATIAPPLSSEVPPFEKRKFGSYVNDDRKKSRSRRAWS